MYHVKTGEWHFLSYTLNSMIVAMLCCFVSERRFFSYLIVRWIHLFAKAATPISGWFVVLILKSQRGRIANHSALSQEISIEKHSADCRRSIPMFRKVTPRPVMYIYIYMYIYNSKNGYDKSLVPISSLFSHQLL